jgi:hypothetical protein
MTDLSSLTVSLTKHGAHKIAALLNKFEPDNVLENTWDTFGGIKIDQAQARKNLSALHDDRLPGVWNEVKHRGRATINAAVLIGIIFSHHELIQAMIVGSAGNGQGTIKKEQFNARKAYSNLKNDFIELGFATDNDEDKFSYDIRPILRDTAFGPLAGELLRLKLSEAKWAGTNDLTEECLSLGFQNVFGLSEGQFSQWIDGHKQYNEDELRDTVDADKETTSRFQFKAGHTQRKEGDVERKGHGTTPKARLIHNELQNKLVKHLTKLYGADNIQTEAPTGAAGTSIDLVRKDGINFIFYEIKTSPSLKKCIREAIPQLLEYAYWPKEQRASELIIVSQNRPTTDAKNYLFHLRDVFQIPIHHETIDIATGLLSARI